MEWSPQQEAALAAVNRWLKRGSEQVFYLAGFAGTGKTTLAVDLASGTEGLVLFGAFTGKAALVMRSKGCKDASTLHSMIYQLDEHYEGSPRFALNQNSPVRNAALVVVDEVSMVDETLGRDLLSFGTKVLVLGDPAQLPPVKGEGFFTSRKPDVMLTEVHRQAADNPIIRMSMDVREGRGLVYGTYGSSRVITRDEIDAKAVLGADQVLVGLNRTRHSFNRRIRDLRGFGGICEAGERLVCLRNKREKGLLNGGIWSVESVEDEDDADVVMRIRPVDAGMSKRRVEVTVPLAFFEGRESDLSWGDRREKEEFTYGYALTVHISQGSQWEHIIVFDESKAFRDNNREWLYTAITRASEAVTVVM